MNILFLLIISVLSVIITMNAGVAYAQYGGPAIGPSVHISDIISSANNVYVLWNGMDPNTKSPVSFLKASNDNGTNFGKNINFTKYGISQNDLYGSNVKMASSENNLYLAWTDWANNSVGPNVFFTKSNDGGGTFDKPLKIKTGSGISPIAAIGSSGTNVYVLMYNSTDSDYSDLLLATSSDNGETFGKPLSLSTNHKLMMGNVQMVTLGDNVYVVASGSYWGSQNGAIVFYASHDDGKSFAPVIIADDVMAFIPQVKVSGNDIYVIWTQMAGQGSALFFEKSIDGGASFGNKIQVNQDGDPRWPQLAVSKNEIFVMWVQSFPSGGNKLLLSKSTDHGDTFSAPLNLGGFTSGTFDFSQMGILENGDIFAIWTGEYDPSYSHSGLFFRKSTDGGTTFGDIYDLNVLGNTAILNPKVVSVQNHIYVVGDSGSPGINDIIFRASSDSGETFMGPINLNSDDPVHNSSPSKLVPIPEFKPDIPTSVPANSQFSNSQNASFVLGQLDFVSNSANPTASTFSMPHFIVFDSQGDLWVSDGGNDRVLEFTPPFTIGKSASVVLGQKDFTSWQVLNGTNPKSLYHPQGLAFDKDGNLWVADGASDRVLEFEPPFKTGQVPSLVLGQKDFGVGDYPQSGTAQSMYYPEGIAFDPDGNLWVADTNSKLLEFKHPFSNGQEVALTLGNITQNSGMSASTMNSPLGIAFDSKGNLWVADSVNYRVLQFDPPFSNNQGASLVLGHQDFVTGGEGASSNASSFRDPYGITFDSQGNLWVTDSGNNRVLEFVPPFTNGQQASLILGQASFNAGAIDTTGHTINSLNQPQGLAFDKDGNLWVTDSENNRILVFKSNQSTNSQIVFPDFLNSTKSTNANLPNAYEQVAHQMEECSKNLGISSNNHTAINLVLDSSEFKSKVQGYDYKFNGIANSFHSCTLDSVEAVYALYDNSGKYVKSLYVSIDPSLTKILGIKEETANARYGGAQYNNTSSSPTLQEQLDTARLQTEKQKQNERQNADIRNATVLAEIGMPITAGISIAVFMFRKRK